jgi:hypothetical protein
LGNTILRAETAAIAAVAVAAAELFQETPQGKSSFPQLSSI